ncbi:MAG TPA: cellulase family glycosylhydrolase [Candidatus Sulfopaludibacter sp.]|nr:cellulase family glycosylhydrolase [Candidatus Sulfopaludibacter sp.]
MKLSIPCLAVLLMVSPLIPLHAELAFRNFITVRGDRLMDGNQPFRFISFNIPNLLIVEDNVPFTETNAWRLPDEFELQDALATVRQMGGTVVRTYSIPVWRGDDPPAESSYVLGIDRYNETAFRTCDLALKLANENGVRLIIPLVNNWKWQGGRGEYAGFRSKTADDFWTDPQLVADFERTLRFILTRTNTLTGVRYCDDKAILCWETGNELSSPVSWTHEIARYLKSLDDHHLVMDGVNGGYLHPDSLTDPYVDVVTTHHYPGLWTTKSFTRLIRENWEMARGKKPYVVGEFGFVSTAEMADAMKTIMDTGTAGGLLWSLRFHDRDGGFYWHSEPSGGNLYKAFHWPGSPMGAGYDEIQLMALVRSNAFKIRGLSPPPLPAPAPPQLLPITDAGAISWQGSVGAASYRVERAPKRNGPWKVVGDEIDECAVQYYPPFADESVPRGEWFYRVVAKNESGVSKPSDVVGPVTVTHDTLVDNLNDFSRVYIRQGNLEIKTRDCREAKEDAARATGAAGDALIYKLPTPIAGFHVFAFFPGEVADLKFSLSDDGRTYREVAAGKHEYFSGAGDYNYWKPVRYDAENVTGAGKFLKIEMTGETQIGRVEIIHAPEKN